ncbi:MAG: septum formation initiator family protein [Clostridia bacterium]|nr:septum formation initiator family protein [Clostridia bacterium]
MKTDNLNFFVKLTMIVIIVFCIVSIVRLRTSYRDLEATEAEMNEQKIAYLDEIDRLKEELDHEMDQDYVMRIARERLNYYLPDEILFYSDR